MHNLTKKWLNYAHPKRDWFNQPYQVGSNLKWIHKDELFTFLDETWSDGALLSQLSIASKFFKFDSAEVKLWPCKCQLLDCEAGREVQLQSLTSPLILHGFWWNFGSISLAQVAFHRHQPCTIWRSEEAPLSPEARMSNLKQFEAEMRKLWGKQITQPLISTSELL